MARLTRKTLQKEAKRLGAYKLTSDVYEYENAISKLYRLEEVNEHDSRFDADSFNQFIRMVKAENAAAYMADANKCIIALVLMVTTVNCTWLELQILTTIF